MQLDSFNSLFNLKPTDISLFETLLSSSPLKASDLAKQASLNRTSIYDSLERLVSQGLIYEIAKSGVKMFSAQPFEKITRLAQEKANKMLAVRADLKKIETAMLKEQKQYMPRFQIYEGRSELEQMMKDVLFYENITVIGYWPVKKIMASLSPAWLAEFHKKRLKNNIHLKIIWPREQIPALAKHPYLKVNPDNKREVRLAPPGTNFSLGYTIYGQTVRFISSAKENYGFLIESRELAETLRSQFEIIWSIAKPFKNKVR